jgi:hypothetical protein
LSLSLSLGSLRSATSSTADCTTLR